jgi:serine/threonine protein kinase
VHTDVRAARGAARTARQAAGADLQAHDIWALGVLAYEAVTGTRALLSIDDVRSCASGSSPYPWELPAAELHPAWRASRLRHLLQPCLARDAAKRPSAVSLTVSVSRFGHSYEDGMALAQVAPGVTATVTPDSDNLHARSV